MDFTPSEAQRELAALTRRIVTDQVTTDMLVAAETAGERLDQPLWSLLATAGVLSAEVGLVERCSVLIELGRVLAPVPYLSTVAAAGATLAEFGSADQRDRWLIPAPAGQVVLAVAPFDDYAARPSAAGRSEPSWRLSGRQAGTPEAVAPEAVAPEAGAAWQLTGEVSGVTAGPVADAFLVAAETPAGSAVFVVLPTDPGVTVERQQMVDNDDAALVRLADVPLAEDRRLAGSGLAGSGLAGSGASSWLADRVTVGLCAYQLGVLQRALELTSEHARTRIQFGRPIGAFQAVSQRLADAYVDVQAAELALWNAAWILENPADTAGSDAGAGPEAAAEAAAAVATAKFWAAEAGHRVAHTLVHVHGGTGIDLEHPVHRFFLAAKRTEFEQGGATAHLLHLANALASK